MNTNTQRCPHCNRPVAPDSLFCEWCGQPLRSQASAPTQQAAPIPQAVPPQQATPPPTAGPPPGSPPGPPPTAYPPPAVQPQPQAPPPTTPPQPPRKTSRLLIIALIAGLLLCCLVAGIGGVILWQRSQAKPVPTPTISGTVPEQPGTAPSAPVGVAALAGEWELIEDPYGDVGAHFRLELQPDGRLRLLLEDEFDNIEGIEDLEQYYLELTPDGENRWRGDATTLIWSAETGNYDEITRDPYVLILSQDGQQITLGPPDSEGSIARRVSGP